MNSRESPRKDHASQRVRWGTQVDGDLAPNMGCRSPECHLIRSVIKKNDVEQIGSNKQNVCKSGW